jgi:hypothetical protein
VRSCFHLVLEKSLFKASAIHIVGAFLVHGVYLIADLDSNQLMYRSISGILMVDNF